MMKWGSLAALFLAAGALAQGLPFPGPGFKTFGGGGFTNTKSITTGNNAGSPASGITRTQGTGTSRQKMTFNFWYYSPSSGTAGVIISDAASSTDQIGMTSGGSAVIFLNSGADGYGFCANGIAQDDAWHQITVQIDTANATAANRVIGYNDQVDCSFVPLVAITANYTTSWGANGTTEKLNAWAGVTSEVVDEVAKLDNVLQAPSSFASGGHAADLSALSFNAQGYWIRFETGVASTVGDDSSGNSNAFANVDYTNADFSSSVP